jgi:hypothetical protein
VVAAREPGPALVAAYLALRFSHQST